MFVGSASSVSLILDFCSSGLILGCRTVWLSNASNGVEFAVKFLVWNWVRLVDLWMTFLFGTCLLCSDLKSWKLFFANRDTVDYGVFLEISSCSICYLLASFRVYLDVCLCNILGATIWLSVWYILISFMLVLKFCLLRWVYILARISFVSTLYWYSSNGYLMLEGLKSWEYLFGWLCFGLTECCGFRAQSGVFAAWLFGESSQSSSTFGSVICRCLG